MARDYYRSGYNDEARAAGTPDYALSDHAQIVGYQDEQGRWRAVTDSDWRFPRDEDLAVSEKYLIAINNRAPGSPPNMPNMVHWIGPVDGISLDDIYDYYVAGYEELAG